MGADIFHVIRIFGISGDGEDEEVLGEHEEVVEMIIEKNNLLSIFESTNVGNQE